MDYIESFKKRYQKYLYAVNTYPNVMDNELKIAYEMMKVEDDNIILNIPSAGTDLKKYIYNNNVTYHEFETSPDFSSVGYNLCSFENIPLESKSVDRIIVLASFHHVSIEDRPKIYKEFKRILKDDGLFVIGDVIKDSKQDKWLNEFVNKWNSKGHKGFFFDLSTKNDENLLKRCGFTTEVYKKKYTWDFKDEKEMTDFVINLFNLDLMERDHLINYIKEYLNYNSDENRCWFEWELVYFISKISQVHVQCDVDKPCYLHLE
jgi:SAM-dependent methyltransferase